MVDSAWTRYRRQMGRTFLLSCATLLTITGLAYALVLAIVLPCCVLGVLSDECAFLWGEFFGPPGPLPMGTLPTKIALSYGPTYGVSGHKRICIIDTDGSVKTLWENPEGYTGPTWSPDGSKIMFKKTPLDWESWNDHESWEGYVVNSDGSQVVQLPVGVDWLPEWSPDSQKLLGISKKIDFRHRRIEGDIYAVNSDGTHLVKLTSQPSRYSIARWSPDGEWIAFSAGEPDRLDRDMVYVMPASGLSAVGMQATRLTDRPLRMVEDLYWSPDGSRIAILHKSEPDDGLGFRSALLVVRSDGGGEACSRSIGGTIYEGRFAWSPDGSHFAFTGEHYDGRWNPVSVYVMAADCTEMISSGLSSTAHGYYPEFAWSPDGRKLAFTNNPDLEHGSRYEAPWEIWVMNRDGSGLTRLSAGNDRAPAWSPDGTKIAFRRRGEIYVMNADGSQQTRVTYGRDDVYEFAWAPR